VTGSVDIVEEMRIGEVIDLLGLSQIDFIRPVLIVTLRTAGEVVGKNGATTTLEPATEDASIMYPIEEMPCMNEVFRRPR